MCLEECQMRLVSSCRNLCTSKARAPPATNLTHIKKQREERFTIVIRQKRRKHSDFHSLTLRSRSLSPFFPPSHLANGGTEISNIQFLCCKTYFDLFTRSEYSPFTTATPPHFSPQSNEEDSVYLSLSARCREGPR